MVKTFLEWCENNNAVPSPEAVDKFISFIGGSYSTSYVNHAKTTLKEFAEWFVKTWGSG